MRSRSSKIVIVGALIANGQVKGQDGNWHTDHGDKTVLYFPLQWAPEWGGSTYFKIDDVETQIQYKQNRLLAFRSDILHYGLAPAVGQHSSYFYCFQLTYQQLHKRRQRRLIRGDLLFHLYTGWSPAVLSYTGCARISLLQAILWAGLAASASSRHGRKFTLAAMIIRSIVPRYGRTRWRHARARQSGGRPLALQGPPPRLRCSNTRRRRFRARRRQAARAGDRGPSLRPAHRPVGRRGRDRHTAASRRDV